MNDFKNMKLILMLIGIMFVLSLIYSLFGCTKTVKQVVNVHDTTFVEKIRIDTFYQQGKAKDSVIISKTDTIREFKVYHDSILVKDSIFVKEKGDTIYIYKERWNTKIDMKHDTIWKTNTDTMFAMKYDTIIIYRSLQSEDSTKYVKEHNSEVTKQKLNWWVKPLLVFIVLTLLFIVGLTIYKKFFK